MHCPFSHKLGKVLHSSISWPSGPNPDSKHNLSKASVPLPGQISQLFDIPKVELDFSAEPHAAPMAQQHSAFVTVICCWLPTNNEEESMKIKETSKPAFFSGYQAKICVILLVNSKNLIPPLSFLSNLSLDIYFLQSFENITLAAAYMNSNKYWGNQ